MMMYVNVDAAVPIPGKSFRCISRGLDESFINESFVTKHVCIRDFGSTTVGWEP